MSFIESLGDLDIGYGTDEGKYIMKDFIFAGHKMFSEGN